MAKNRTRHLRRWRVVIRCVLWCFLCLTGPPPLYRFSHTHSKTGCSHYIEINNQSQRQSVFKSFVYHSISRKLCSVIMLTHSHYPFSWKSNTCLFSTPLQVCMSTLAGKALSVCLLVNIYNGNAPTLTMQSTKMKNVNRSVVTFKITTV